MIYIALIKTDDNKPLKVVIRDDVKEIKAYLLSIPAMYAIQSFTTWDNENRVMHQFSLKDLVEFLKD